MQSYNDLMAKAKELMAEAERVRAEQKTIHIAAVKELMMEHGLTLEDLGTRPLKKKAPKGSAPKAEKAAAQYKGPNGELWSGGPGRRPSWVNELKAKGVDMEQYRIAA